MQLTSKLLAASALLALASAAPVLAADKVSFGTNWLAEAEHGGFYQAIADGTYAKAGLDVTIVQGGPQAANEALLISGKIDFYMGGQFSLYDDIKQGIPVINVAAMFQKDPQILMTHKGVGMDTFADIAKASTIFMGKDVFVTDFVWMKANFKGFHDEQYKPYTFNPAPFIADKMSAQQGYLTSEPLAVKKAMGEEPNVFLFADAGYAPYSTTIETTTKNVAEKPDLVQRFVGGLRAALNDGDVEAVLLIRAVGDSLVEAAMLALGEPVGAVADLVDRQRRRCRSNRQERAGGEQPGCEFHWSFPC